MSELRDAAFGYKVDPVSGKVIGAHGLPIGTPNTRGYIQIDARKRGGGMPFAHRIIWESVHGPIPEGLEINHKNGVKDDNRIENLELVTRSGNMRHAFDNGLKSNAGNSSPRRILDSTKVAEIRRRHEMGERPAHLAREFGVSRPTVSAIVHGRNWKAA